MAGQSFFTVETHLNNYREAAEGEPIKVTTQVLDLDEKRLHIFHAMYHGETNDLLATGEQMLLHVDTGDGARTAPIAPEVHEALRAIHAAHAGLPKPDQVGHVIGIRRKASA